MKRPGSRTGLISSPFMDSHDYAVAPRYEFLESIRVRTSEQAAQHVRRNVELIVAALNHTKFTPDLDHNFLTGKKLVKIVPKVIYAAHEYCKALVGRRLESELKLMVVAQLVRIGLARKNDDASVRMRPLSSRQYLDRQRRIAGNESRQIDHSTREGSQG